MHIVLMTRLVVCLVLAGVALVAPAQAQPGGLAPRVGVAAPPAGGHPPVACGHGRQSSQTPLLCTVDITGARALAVDEHTNRVFLAQGDGGAGYVSMFDARSGALRRTVAVSSFALAIAADEATGHVFVAMPSSRSVSMLDARTGTVLRTTRVATDPVNVAVAVRAGRVFAIGANDSNVIVLDATSGRVVASISLRHGPFSTLAVAERAGRVFLTGMFMAAVVMFDARTGQVLRTVPGPGGILAVDEQSGRVYTGAGTVLDARTGNPLPLVVPFRGALTVAFDPHIGRLIAPTSVSVDLFDAHSGRLLHSVNVDTQPAAVPVVLGQRGRVAVLLSSPLNENGDVVGSGYLLVLDERKGTIVRRIDASGVDFIELYDLMVVDNRTNRLFVIDGHGLDVFDAARL